MAAVYAILIVVVVVVGFTWQSSTCNAMIGRWAAERGYSVLSQRFSIFGGPFFFRGKNQPVYEVTVRDMTGQEHHGWLKLGSFWLGILSYEVAENFDS